MMTQEANQTLKTERHIFKEYQGGCLVTDKVGGMGLWFTEEELSEVIEILKKFQSSPKRPCIPDPTVTSPLLGDGKKNANPADDAVRSDVGHE